MNRIRVLDMSVANKIAAGEVVERPASVIKELVENSIDAQAKAVTIEIVDGGISYMRVTDNGIGMTRDDAKNCFLRHATSKIHDTDDLFAIETLGFRGEAMASIAAVARVTLKTHRPDDNYGTRVIIDGGAMREVEACGCPDGTTVEVSDLFFNVPARLKFMKAARTEASYISDYVLRMILSRPDISFKFINNSNIIYQSNGDGDLKNAIYDVYGGEVIPHLRPVLYDDGYVKISGFVGTEQISRPNRTQQSIFVNHRYIRSQKLSSALHEAYDTRIMTGRFPFCVLNIDIEYSNVDVNVHPNKLEVKFTDEKRVAFGVCESVKEALGQISVPIYRFETKQETDREEVEITPKMSDELFANLMRQANFIDEAQEETVPNGDKQQKADSQSQKVQETTFEEPKLQESNREEAKSQGERQETVPFYPADVSYVEIPDSEFEKLGFEINKRFAQNELANEPAQVEFDVAPYEILGCAFDSFWLICQNENLFIMDQHAAHERMLYEQAVSGELKSSTQMLLIPIVVKLTSEEYDVFSDNIELFNEFGFVVESFGMLTVRILAVPNILNRVEDETFFKDALAMLARQKNVTLIDMKRESLIKASCKGAIKLGNAVPKMMIKSILDEYNENGIPLTCPHGRPVMVALTKKELFKKFKRIV